MFTGVLPETVAARSLARQQTEISGTIPLSRLKRLREALGAVEVPDTPDTETQIDVSVVFELDRNDRVVVNVKGTYLLHPVCQRCMQRCDVSGEVAARLTLVSDEDALLALPLEQDGLIVGGDTLTTAEVVEDELLLALPMYATHDEACTDLGPLAEEPVDENNGQVETQRPFANLADMMRDAKKDAD